MHRHPLAPEKLTGSLTATAAAISVAAVCATRAASGASSVRRSPSRRWFSYRPRCCPAAARLRAPRWPCARHICCATR